MNTEIRDRAVAEMRSAMKKISAGAEPTENPALAIAGFIHCLVPSLQLDWNFVKEIAGAVDEKVPPDGKPK